ncbi:L,D-transpeptidase family protein [Microbulbifer litoralis]|uniref:L,D-transpeptidase family protein n=1 Tax=Microbulbifer litoralis TaxID=2933965 RepID=UPI002028D63D|nr:L,D-transpeptidase family protein [Microbulbifer sp. GX H0434]
MHSSRRNWSPILYASLILFLGALLVAPSGWANPRGGNWFDEHAAASASGPSKIRISLSEQRAYLYKGGKLVGVSKVSSGKKGYGTSPGHFRVLSKHPRHRSSIYGSYVDRRTGRVVKANVNTRKDRRPAGTYYRGAKMNNYIRFNGGIGMHASGHVPNYPASHGCVRMPPQMAQKFFRHVRVGTPVRVTW